MIGSWGMWPLLSWLRKVWQWIILINDVEIWFFIGFFHFDVDRCSGHVHFVSVMVWFGLIFFIDLWSKVEVSRWFVKKLVKSVISFLWQWCWLIFCEARVFLFRLKVIVQQIIQFIKVDIFSSWFALDRFWRLICFSG